MIQFQATIDTWPLNRASAHCSHWEGREGSQKTYHISSGWNFEEPNAMTNLNSSLSFRQTKEREKKTEKKWKTSTSIELGIVSVMLPVVIVPIFFLVSSASCDESILFRKMHALLWSRLDYFYEIFLFYGLCFPFQLAFSFITSLNWSFFGFKFYDFQVNCDDYELKNGQLKHSYALFINICVFISMCCVYILRSVTNP